MNIDFLTIQMILEVIERPFGDSSLQSYSIFRSGIIGAQLPN